jgi:hypothetical protein
MAATSSMRRDSPSGRGSACRKPSASRAPSQAAPMRGLADGAERRSRGDHVGGQLQVQQRRPALGFNGLDATRERCDRFARIGRELAVPAVGARQRGEVGVVEVGAAHPAG